MARIRHIAICSTDAEKLSDFYADVMGMTKMRETKGRWVTDGYLQLALLGPRNGALGINHFGFTIAPEERDRIVERLHKWGLDVEPPPPGLPLVEEKVHDPDGNEFDITSRNLLAGADDLLKGKTHPATIRHIAICSPNPERLVEFYTDVMGLTTMSETVGRWVTDGYLQLALLGTRTRPQGINHWGFTMREGAREEIVERLNKWGRDVEPPPPGLPLVEEKVHDIDGNEFDITSRELVLTAS